MGEREAAIKLWKCGIGSQDKNGIKILNKQGKLFRMYTVLGIGGKKESPFRISYSHEGRKVPESEKKIKAPP